MAHRGRGGRGRGRFGASSYVPQARGDDGTPVFAKKMEGPPPLFPPLKNVPELPDIGKAEEELISRRRRLETFWNASPYYIEKPKEKSMGVAADIERYSDKYKPNLKSKRPPLSSVLKLTSAYFPAELIGQQAQRKSQHKGTSQWIIDASSGKSDLQRLDRLATMEQRNEKNAEDKEGKDDERKGDDDDDDEANEEMDEEEEEIGEDDYAQNFGFDDDDEYLDDDDGGDDEGPTY